MKEINITVTVTYQVCLRNVKVKDDLYEALSEMYDQGQEASMMDDPVQVSLVCDFFRENIKEHDSLFGSEYEINDF